MKFSWYGSRGRFIAFFLIALLMGAQAVTWPEHAPAAQRRLTVDDLFALESVGDPVISPEGKWVAYTVEQVDSEADTRETAVWIVARAGGDPVRMTRKGTSACAPPLESGRILPVVSVRAR